MYISFSNIFKHKDTQLPLHILIIRLVRVVVVVVVNGMTFLDLREEAGKRTGVLQHQRGRLGQRLGLAFLFCFAAVSDIFCKLR